MHAKSMNDSPFAPGADPNSMLASACARASLSFDTSVDDPFAPVESIRATLDVDDWDWRMSLSPSPNLSESDGASFSSMSRPMSVSPLSASSSLPDVDFIDDISPDVDAVGGLHAATGDDVLNIDDIDIDTVLSYCKQLVTDHEHEKVVPTQEPDNEPSLSSPDGQQSTINPMSLPTAGITNAISSSASVQEPCCAQAAAALAPDPPSRRTPSPRRAASASRKRLQVIFEGEDEVDTGPPARLSRPMSTKMRGTTKARASGSAASSTDSAKRKAKSVNTPQVSKATAGTRRRGATREARDISLIHEADPEYVHDSDSSDDDSEWGGEGPTTATTTARPHKRFRYIDLVEAGPDSAIASFQKPGLTDPRSFILDPSTCSACINGFKRPYDLARHIESYHQMKCLQCRVCGLSFSRKDALGRHEQRNRCKNRPTRKRRARKWELAASKEAAAEIDDETAAAFNFKAATDRLRWPHGR